MSDPDRELARILYETIERLAPGSPEDERDWIELREWERALYVNAVRALIDEPVLVRCALARGQTLERPSSASRTDDHETLSVARWPDEVLRDDHPTPSEADCVSSASAEVQVVATYAALAEVFDGCR